MIRQLGWIKREGAKAAECQLFLEPPEIRFKRARDDKLVIDVGDTTDDDEDEQSISDEEEDEDENGAWSSGVGARLRSEGGRVASRLLSLLGL